MTPATPEQLKTLKGIIYGILNCRNQRWYIGQSRHTFRLRYSAGQWWKLATSLPLKNAYCRYGAESFEVYVFESGIVDDEQRDQLEREYIKRFNAVFPSGYCFEEGGQQYGKRVNASSRAKMSQSHLQQRARNYVLLDQNEVEYRFTNISTFAKERGLEIKQLANLLRGACARYKGYHRVGTCLDKYHQGSELKTVIDPEMKEHTFYNTAAFCRKHGLVTCSMQRMVSGLQKHHKGWQLKTTDVKPSGYRWGNENNSHKRYERIILERDDQEYVVTNDIREFCERHDITPQDIYALTRGDQRTTHGFRLVKTEYTKDYLAKHPELV